MNALSLPAGATSQKILFQFFFSKKVPKNVFFGQLSSCLIESHILTKTYKGKMQIQLFTFFG